MKQFSQFGLIAAFTLGAFFSGVGAAELMVGDAAPDFALKGSDGKTHNLKDFKGKQAVVLAWFPKAFTGGWTAECKSLRESGEALKKFDVAYFAASCDTIEDNTRFAKELEADFTILSDSETDTAKAFGVVTEQRRFPFRWTFYVGKDGKLLHIDKKVNVTSHGADIVAKLKELGVAEK